DFSTLHKNRLYRISDVLLKSKDAIEEALYQREKTWFEFEEIVTLYDLTNTYFEGQSLDNELGALGRSKEKRSDCMLVTLALVLDGSGFIKKSQLFKGNVSEPKTLEEMVKPCSKEAIVVMDAGIATEDNIQWLTEHGYKYLVISRKRNLSLPEDISGVVVKEDQDNKVTTYLVKPSEGDEVELYCHSQGMENKGSAMYEKFKQRFIEELEKIKAGLSKKGCTKKYDKVCEKLGRLKEKYSKVASHFELELKADANKENALSLTWHDKETRANKNKGIYCIRANQTHLNNQQIWQTYRMLNDIEAAFRVLKSDLGMRPVYHQTTERISGHIFISILAYHILHCIRFQLKKMDIHDRRET
uniref:IS1634 family transposase n=1 Tax=Cysteiniphilum sp. SYW-8 TaxID=2610890 RepID=UPI00123D7960